MCVFMLVLVPLMLSNTARGERKREEEREREEKEADRTDSILDVLHDGVSEGMHLGSVCAEPHEPHADNGCPDKDLAQAVMI